MSEARAIDTYDRLKAMAVGFEIKPGDRLNEGTLAKSLNVSRTPLREALNRLVAEKLFDFRPGSGFYCRALDQQSIVELFEMRKILETSAIRLAAQRATNSELQILQDDLLENGLSVDGLTVAQACHRDEEFHLSIAKAGGNSELVRSLDRINERIRFIRWIRLSGERISSSKQEHKQIMSALIDRDADKAVAYLADHIESRREEISAAVREGISTIYLEPNGSLASRILEPQT